MEQKRTATEILIQVEAKVTMIYTFMQNLDNTTKLILNRLNSLEKNAELTVYNAPLRAKPSGPQPSVSAPKDGETTSKTKKIQAKKESQKIDETKKVVSVSQKISYSDGSDVTFANVEIFDAEFGNQITSTKTNSAGRWIKVLNPGSYRALITKKGNGKDKQEINLNFTFKISDSDVPIELPDPLYGKKR